LSSANYNSSYGAADSQGDFKIAVDNSTPDNHDAIVNVTMSDHYGNSWTDNVTLRVEPIAASLTVENVSALYDTTSSSYGTSGNGDNVLNKSETVRFNLGIRNTGESGTDMVLVSASTSDPYITLTQPGDLGGNEEICRTIKLIDGTRCTSSSSTKYPIRDTGGSCYSSYDYISNENWGRTFSCSTSSLSSANYNSSYGTADSQGDFKIAVDNSTPDNHDAIVNVTMSDRYGNSWTDNVTLRVEPIAASLTVENVSALYDTTSSSYGTNGDGDGIFEAGETVRFNLGIRNTGESSAKMVLVSAELATLPTISGCTNYITLTQPGDLNGNEEICRTIKSIDGTACSSSSSTKYPIRDTGGSCYSSYDYISNENWGRTFSCSTGSLSSANYNSSYGAADSQGDFKMYAKGCASEQSATINVTMQDMYGNIWTDNVTVTVP